MFHPTVLHTTVLHTTMLHPTTPHSLQPLHQLLHRPLHQLAHSLGRDRATHLRCQAKIFSQIVHRHHTWIVCPLFPVYHLYSFSQPSSFLLLPLPFRVPAVPVV